LLSLVVDLLCALFSRIKRLIVPSVEKLDSLVSKIEFKAKELTVEVKAWFYAYIARLHLYRCSLT